MSKATLEQEETTQDEGMATKPGDQVVEGEDLDNVQFEKPEHWQDKFWDDKEGPDPDKLMKSYNELEKAYHKNCLLYTSPSPRDDL